MAGPPLDSVYPVVFIDALMIKVRDGVVANRPVYLAIGIDCEGAPSRSWACGSARRPGESAKFWLSVLSELRSRGVADVCIVCCDRLTGRPDAIAVVWPQAVVQQCVVLRLDAVERPSRTALELRWRAGCVGSDRVDRLRRRIRRR